MDEAMCAPNGWLMTAFCFLIFLAGMGAGVMSVLVSRAMHPPPDPGPPPKYPYVNDRGQLFWSTRDLLEPIKMKPIPPEKLERWREFLARRAQQQREKL